MPIVISKSLIELCTKCGGKGLIIWDVLVDHHKGDYEEHRKTCGQCDGSGKVVRIEKSSTEVRPFGKDESDYYI
jgi:DnaJ-class molecular chaperone